MIDKMTRLEKLALTSAVSGAVFNVFLYGIGATLQEAQHGPLLYVRVVAAILQAAAFDLVAIATVMGMRHGRRSRWSWMTAVMAALVSALIALDVAGVWAQPWLHAANALIVLAFTLHLLTPPQLDPDERVRLHRLELELNERGQVLSLAEQRLSSLEHLLGQARHEAEQIARRGEQRIRDLEYELSNRPAPQEIEVVEVVKYRLRYEHVAKLLEMCGASSASVSTVRRKLPLLIEQEDYRHV